jgi:hypothetical protein
VECHRRPGHVTVTPPKVMLWGVVGLDLSLMVITNETVYSESYNITTFKVGFPLLNEDRIIYFSRKSYRYQQGSLLLFFAGWGEAPHIQGANVSVVDWPPNSCDLIPIENTRSMIKRRLDVDIHADVEELEDAVHASWDSITQDEINSLVRSFPERVKRMLERGGQNCRVKKAGYL